MTAQALRDIDALGASSTAASIGTFQVRDDESEYNIGDYYATELSEALRRARRHDTTGKEVAD